ncbi:NADH-quinone oxidoreductase subunit A [Polymorphobacter fuscus]|uniref:NADH-quinone oxidoreductase subunit n=1 Tax=Sandarakinorhabdus fusca TaxID=1439888 RepID=A0A7C9GRR8_9SPHN|nr:NADH-quinone oxidoreductase subunit A [Polymorphobacter fuscus]KAB7643741.1 NADH-quinone oxidoreductase subunit A [Polymorphobacter fuscus]MQT18690.1 NADH-quinone oxidoreductase subunit A [Polymorphobacter fuscus]NJC08093.1 NADH-quinone oxidoreductase subunit A [Polymorphobacter fuscus]
MPSFAAPDLAGIDPRFALALHIGIAALVLAIALGLAAWLREPRRDGLGVYESGAPPGPARLAPVTASYVLIAVCFMIFDVEAALLFAWAGAAREVGRPGLVAATVFVVLLLAALAYLWADGALDTGPDRHKKRRTP